MNCSIVLGATGLVGRHLVAMLREDRPVHLIVRRASGMSGGNVDESVVDLARPGSFAHLVKADDLYCCLGTTIKKAGSQEAFRAVDYDLPLNLAALAANNGVRRLFLVTSNGASGTSSNLYLRTKGQLEEAVSKLPFKTIHIARPSLLLGKREESRPVEALAQKFLPSLSFLIPARYRPIEAEDVAKALVALSKSEQPGVHIHENEQLQALAGR